MDARHSIPNSFSSAAGLAGLGPGGEAPVLDEQARFEIIMKHGHRDLVQAVAFNAYGDRCATGSVDGEVRVFNRHRDGVWRLCDSWTAHGGEVLELQWLPPTVYPNLLASLGFDGLFKLWVEDPVAAPGRRFGGQRAKADAGSAAAAAAAFETRSPGSPYRSFALRHNDATRHTFLALLAADGTLTVLENEVPENLSDYSDVDELRVCARPARGEEASFRVCFDPNPDPCYTALRAGVAPDALGLVVAAMDAVKIYRSRPIATTAYGLEGRGQAFYLAAEIKGHRGLVRDVAWAPGNFRGYDLLATACQDGYVRVVRLETPFHAADDGKSWAAADMVPKVVEPVDSNASSNNNASGTGTARRRRDTRQSVSSLLSAAATSHSSPSLIAAGAAAAAAAAATTAAQHAASTPVSVSSSLSSTTRDGGAAAADEGVPEPVNGGGSSSSSTTAAALDNNNNSAVAAAGAAAGAKDGPASANTSFGSSGLSTIADSSTGSVGSAGGGEGGGGAIGGGSGGVGGSGSSGLGVGGGVGGAAAAETAGTATAAGRGRLAADRRFTGGAGEVRHTVREVCRLENDRTPVWRVSFDDDGQILGSVGDDGKLVCYRQKPDGVWARSSELTVMKTRRV